MGAPQAGQFVDGFGFIGSAGVLTETQQEVTGKMIFTETFPEVIPRCGPGIQTITEAAQNHHQGKLPQGISRGYAACMTARSIIHLCSVLLLPALLAPASARPALQPRLWFAADGADITATLHSHAAPQAARVVLQKADGTMTTVSVGGLDGHSRRYLANVRLAEGREFREWKFAKLPDEAAGFPDKVNGAFLRVVCEDHEFSTACVEILRDDFTRRWYPLKHLHPDDKALAQKLQAASDTTRKPSTLTWPARYEAYTPERDAAVCNFHATEHFLFHWGNSREASGKDWWKEGRQEQTFAWFERVWRHFEDAGAPMPMAPGTPNAAKRAKIPVYITGTGLPKHRDGFAFGGESILMHPGALGPGSSVVGHEFTHTMQLHMGGFRNSPLVGWFWECHANWSSHQFMPDYPGAFEVWLARAHYELNSSRHNYGSWLFLQQLTEDPRFGPGFCYDIWLHNRKDAKDSSIEDPLQTIMRLGVERGIWSGDGTAGFGDTIGEMAARMPAMDFGPQWAYLRSLRVLSEIGESARLRTVLQPVPDRTGWWRPLWSHTPRQYGINLIDLVPDGSGAPVEVEFKGLARAHAGFRTTLVAVEPSGRASYSRMTRGGRLSLTPGSAQRVVLAVAATPERYAPDEFRPGYGRKPRFPYEITVRGASPATAPPLPELRAEGSRHPNGGGLVAASAKVAPTAFVGPDAKVLDGAEVSGTARIEDHAVVRGSARVGDAAVVRGHATVRDQARVTGNARVGGFARVGGQTEITGQARVLEYVHAGGNGRIGGDAFVRGWGEIHTVAEAPIEGGTVAGEDLECHLSGRNTPITGGMLYGYLNSDILAKELEDNRHLFARWSFDQPDGEVLPDIHADATGILRGSPVFTTEGTRRVLAFERPGQHVLIEPHVADSAALTFDFLVKWAGGPPGQAVFDFGGPEASLAFSPSDTKGRSVLVMRRGKTSAAATGPALQPGRWTRVTLSAGDGSLRLFLDGREAGSAATALTPGDLAVVCGYLGRSFAGTAPFRGRLDDFSIYRRAVTDVSTLPQPWKTPADWRIAGGTWTLENGVFRQENATAPEAVLHLPGSESWTGVIISLEARRLAGPNAFRVHFRSPAPGKGWVADFGQDGRGTALKENGVTFGGPNYFVEPDWNAWQKVTLRVEGTAVSVELNGKKATETTKAVEPAAGGFALGTRLSSAEFRNIRVTDLEGRVLYASEQAP